MRRWLWTKTVYRDGEHTDIRMFGGTFHANVSTNFNPGTWFIYIPWFRITVSKIDELGLGVKWLSTIKVIYFHFLWRHGQISRQ